MLHEHPDSAAVFVWDREAIVAGGIKLKRLVFLAECLEEFPPTLDVRAGDPAQEVVLAARATGAGHVLAQRTPDPRLQTIALRIANTLPVVWYDPPPFVEDTRTLDLKRFSRYWQRAQSSAMQPTR